MTTRPIKPNSALRHTTVATSFFCGLAIAAVHAAAVTSEISLTPLVAQNDVMGEPMQAPMPPDQAMPSAEMTDPMSESSMHPMAMGKKMGPMLPLLILEMEFVILFQFMKEYVFYSFYFYSIYFYFFNYINIISMLFLMLL